MRRILFYDLETTGLDCRRHSIHQIALRVEIDGEVVESLNMNVRPHTKAEFDPIAVEMSGKTMEQMKSHEPMKVCHDKLIKFLDRYVDRYDKRDKLHLAGYNNSSFDDGFLRAWFEQNGNQFFGAYFFSGPIDVFVLAAQYLMDERKNLKDFKLATVAEYLGVEVDEEKTHEGLYDVDLTRRIYKIVTDENAKSDGFEF